MLFWTSVALYCCVAPGSSTAFWDMVAATWAQRASCLDLDAAADWLDVVIETEVGEISDRKCAGFEAEGAAAAGIAMVTVLPC